MICSDKMISFIHVNEDGTPWARGIERYAIAEGCWGDDDRRMQPESVEVIVNEMLPSRPEAKPGEKPFAPLKK